MATVKRIGPVSAFKIGLVLYAAIGRLAGIVVALFSMVAGSVGSMASARNSETAWLFGMGIWAIISLPICYGIVGGVAAAISAALYNLIAGWVDGLEAEIN